MLHRSKGIKIPGLKVSPSTPTPEQLEKILRFTRSDYKAEDFYIGQLYMAHNAVDRDKERFSEALLRKFAETAVRKTMLLDHGTYNSQRSAIGKFFDVAIEEIPVSEFKKVREDDHFVWLSNDEFFELKMPKGIDEVVFLVPWFYVPRAAVDEKEIAKIDTGIYDWASIGFSAHQCNAVKGPNDEVLFWEYSSGPSSEMREGSLVYLGAQQGAAVKSAKDDQHPLFEEETSRETEGGDKNMDLLKLLGAALGKAFGSEDDAVKHIKGMGEDVRIAKDKVTELEGKVKTAEAAQAAAESKAKELEAEAEGLKKHAEYGKKYFDGLADRLVSAKAKLVPEDKPMDEDARKALRETVGRYDITHLEDEVKHYEAVVAEKFPDEPQTKGGDAEAARDKSGKPDSEDKKEPGSSLDFDEEGGKG